MLTIPLASEGAGIGHGVLAMHGGTGSGGEQEIPLGAMIFGSDLEDPPLGKMGAGPGLDSHRARHVLGYLRVFVVMIALICTKSFQPLTLYLVQRFVQI